MMSPFYMEDNDGSQGCSCLKRAYFDFDFTFSPGKAGAQVISPL